MGDRILGVACILGAAGMAWAAQGYVAAFSYEPVGPRAFPLLLAALLAVGGAWLVLRPGQPTGAYAGVPVGPVLLCVGAVAAYTLAFEYLGYPLATALMAVPVGMAFGSGALRSLLAGLVLGVTTFLMFDRLLDVVLPAGVLAPVFGAS